MKLELENISVSLGGNKILDDVSFCVPEGRFVSILGVSGSGKSTLLKIIAGLLPQSAGSVMIGGRCADKVPAHKRGTVIVFQDYRLFPHMSVAENIGFPLRMKGVPQKECLKRASQLLGKVQLEGFEGRKPHEMSGGQIQRVALARSLAADPGVLLLDEPFSNLDENLRKEMRALVLGLQREYGITTVLVTHDRAEALSMSDGIVLISEGRVLQADTPERIFERPNSPQVADYFGDTFYIGGTVRDGVFKSEYIDFDAKKPDGAYRAMLRPSSIKSVVKGEGAFRVVSVSYQGDRYELTLESRDRALRLSAQVPELHGLSAGDFAEVEFDAGKAVLF
ncbi:MAG: ABC transporter ATP-binding protein [Bacillota bacterium]